MNARVSESPLFLYSNSLLQGASLVSKQLSKSQFQQYEPQTFLQSGEVLQLQANAALTRRKVKAKGEVDNERSLSAACPSLLPWHPVVASPTYRKNLLKDSRKFGSDLGRYGCEWKRDQQSCRLDGGCSREGLGSSTHPRRIANDEPGRKGRTTMNKCLWGSASARISRERTH